METTRLVHRAPMRVIGLQTRVNVIGDEEEAWRRFNREALALRIPNARAPLAVLAFRLDPVGDAYTLLLGAEVSSLADVPEGLVGREFPAADYAVLASCRGPVREILNEVWERAARLSECAGKMRSFAHDFEVHDQRAANPRKARLDLYLSLK